MSTLAFSDLSNILLTNFGKMIVDTLTQRGPGNDAIPGNSFWGLLAKHGRVIIGAADENATKPMEWGVHTATQSAVSYGVDDNYGSYTPETYAQAQIEWKRWGTPFSVDDLVAWALGKGGNAARGDINAIEEGIKRRLKALVDKGNTMLVSDGTGNSSKDVTGAKAFLASAGTYATLSLAASYWQPNITAVGGAITKALLDSMFVSLEDDDGLTDSLVMVMRRNQWHRVRNLFADNIRYAPGENGIGNPTQPIYSDGGISVPIEIISGGMPDDEIWFLNMNDLAFYLADQVPNAALKSDKAETIMHEGIPVGVVQVYENRDVSNCWFRMWGQLVCSRPKRQGAYQTLTT